jgi:peptidyl-dipeptidase Dcp
MKKLTFVSFIILIMTLVSCNKNEPCNSDNPLLCSYNTPFEVPPFEKIQNKHFKPAFEEAIKQHNDEIAAIVNNTEAPTFENTVAALDFSGILLEKIGSVFYNLNSANTNDSIQQIAQEVSPMLSAHEDEILFNAQLFSRIKAVYDQKSTLKLTPQQDRVLSETYKDFISGGAGLDSINKEKLGKINSELSVLTLKFGQNLLAETNAYKLTIDNKNDLEGLPQGLIDAAAEDAAKDGKAGKWVFTLNNPSVMPFLQYSAKRDLREKMFRAYMMRGNNGNDKDNKALINQIANLRLQRAKLLGYTDHASLVLDRNMALNSQNVYNLLNQLWEPALKRAKGEMADLQSFIDKEGKSFKLEAWDWRYYAEKVRKEKYDLDEEQLKPYFKLENVREGIFQVANKLYGLQFSEINDIPKYHPDVVAYEVKNSNGSHLAVLYLDFFPRESKRGGAWMTSYRDQYKKDGQNISPIISLVCNFTKPTADKPSLLTLDEVETFFHEFGHGLHGMLSNCTYRSVSGTSVSRDFVELPSQIMENWAVEPEVLALYAKHYKTGEAMPASIIEKMEKSQYFNQGFATVEYLAASFLDMGFHTKSDTASFNVVDFEKATLDKINLMPEIISRYRSTYFNHIFAGGYSAGYYSYVWAEILDADAFDAFKQKGIFDPSMAKAFRENILEKGGSEDPMVLYKRFRGAEPQITPLLKRRGLL